MSRILSENKFKYAVLKGSFLIPFMYEPGIRTSNDIDILINKSDVSLLQELLKSEDFVQGYFRDGEIIPASRREIIDSLMNNGETIPFMKMINNELLTMDINFSLDFKADNKIVGDILTDCVDMVKDEINLKTLNPVDFIIHLCCHLYKEATTYDWVIRRRDLMLYKFSDINLFLHKYSDEKYLSLLADRIKQFNVEKECYYTFENSAIIYPQIRNIFKFNEFINDIKPDNLDFMKQIIYPREKRLFKYDMDFVDWFFCDNRIKALNEIKYEET